MINIEENLQDVLYRIKMAAEKVHRDFDNVTLVAVTKSFDVPIIKEAIKFGIKDIGETKVQEAEKKQKELGKLSKKVKWHMIGHIQNNKAKDVAKIFDYVHSIDDMKVAKKISETCVRIKKEIPVLVQVNTSGLTYGVKPEKTVEFVNELRKLNGIQVRGLMTIAPFCADKEETRPYFRQLKELAEKCFLKELSIGMSNDFEVAIQEGATMVRIGTAIFGERIK
jgi:pyridoxal phosphate enzyme (YggS family)